MIFFFYELYDKFWIRLYDCGNLIYEFLQTIQCYIISSFRLKIVWF